MGGLRYGRGAVHACAGHKLLTGYKLFGLDLLGSVLICLVLIGACFFNMAHVLIIVLWVDVGHC